MKRGLAILPLEVLADVSEHPMITRQMLAQIADNNGDPMFTNKLQKLLHGCGKQTLHYLDISSRQACETTQEPKIEPERQAKLSVAPHGNSYISFVNQEEIYNECEFPENEMPENIKAFKKLSIGYFDDQVLDFLHKIKPILNNVFLGITSTKSTTNMRIMFGHLFPLLGSIRGIQCDHNGMELLEQHFPGTLALAKELDLVDPQPALIPTYLRWLSAPQDFGLHGPRSLRAEADSQTIFAFVDAVRKQFLTAVTQSAFIIFLEFYRLEQHNRAEEQTIENAATKEELTVRNASFTTSFGFDAHFVKILRHPIGCEAKMREWIKKQAYFEKKYSHAEASKEIWIWDPTIGHISKKVKALDQDKDETMDDDKDEAGPSIPAKKMRKE